MLAILCKTFFTSMVTSYPIHQGCLALKMIGQPLNQCKHWQINKSSTAFWLS